jgi:hypothetical protein
MAQGFKIDRAVGSAIRGLLKKSDLTPSKRGQFITPESNVLVRNTFSAAIPPYSVLQPVDVFLQGTKPIIDVTQYDGTYDGEFLFSSHYPIEPDAIGMAQSSRVVRCVYADGDGTGNYQPKANDWKLEVGGSYAWGCGGTGTSDQMIGIIAGGGESGACPDHLQDQDIIDAADAEFVQVVRTVDGQRCYALAELQGVICDSTSPPSGSSPSTSVSPSWPSLPSTSFSDCLSEWGSDCLPDSPGLPSMSASSPPP